MTLTRAQYRLRIGQRMDAASTGSGTAWSTSAGSQRWDTTANSEVDNTLSQVFDQEWRRILQAQENYRMASWTPSSDGTTGRYNLSDIQTLTGDTQKRLYRVLSFAIDNFPFQEVAAQDWVNAEALNPLSRVYWLEDVHIMCLPKDYSKQATIWTSYIPTRPDGLSADSIAVDFPAGYEEVLILETAGRLLGKGGLETSSAVWMKQEAENLRADMLTDIGRLSSRARKVAYADYSADYGG